MSATRSEPPQKAASPRSRAERGADGARPASPLKVALPTRPASSRRSAVCPPRYRTVQRAIYPEEGLDVAPLSRGVAGRCHRARLTQIHFETRYALGPSSGSRRPASRRINCAERGESAPGCAGRPHERSSGAAAHLPHTGGRAAPERSAIAHPQVDFSEHKGQ